MRKSQRVWRGRDYTDDSWQEDRLIIPGITGRTVRYRCHGMSYCAMQALLWCVIPWIIIFWIHSTSYVGIWPTRSAGIQGREGDRRQIHIYGDIQGYLQVCCIHIMTRITYRFCFSNRMSTYTPKTITFHVNAGNSKQNIFGAAKPGVYYYYCHHVTQRISHHWRTPSYIWLTDYPQYKQNKSIWRLESAYTATVCN